MFGDNLFLQQVHTEVNVRYKGLDKFKFSFTFSLEDHLAEVFPFSGLKSMAVVVVGRDFATVHCTYSISK